MRYLLLGASLQKKSLNKKLVHVLAKKGEKQGIEMDNVAFESLDIPLYNADIQNNKGIPEDVVTYGKRIGEADAWVISSPEYNASTPAPLKNLIDWLSRLSPPPFKEKPVLLLSASPSLIGGNRGLWVTRISLEVCGAYVYPQMFSLSRANEGFDEKGALADPEMDQKLETLLSSFHSYAKSLRECL